MLQKLILHISLALRAYIDSQITFTITHQRTKDRPAFIFVVRRFVAKRDIILWRNNTLYFPPRTRSYQRLEGHQYDFTFFSVTVSKKKTLFMHLYKSRSRRRQFITMKSRSDEPEIYETYTNKHILYLRDSLHKKLTLSIILLNWKNLEKNIYHRLNYCITKRTRYTQDILYISIVLFDLFDLK